MRYQIVIKRAPVSPQFGARWAERPFQPTKDFTAAREMYEQATKLYANIEEVVVLVTDAEEAGQVTKALDEQFNRYLQGKPFDHVDMTDDGIRAHIEFAPLKDTPPYFPAKALWRWPLPKGELHGLIALMGKVAAGALGGARDGRATYGLMPFDQLDTDPTMPPPPVAFAPEGQEYPDTYEDGLDHSEEESTPTNEEATPDGGE